MAEPCFAITGDDARHYISPLDRTRTNKKSITTVKKQGVPNPVLDKWQIKKVAACVLDQFEIIRILRERALSVAK
jgi:hypothetical protein